MQELLEELGIFPQSWDEIQEELRNRIPQYEFEKFKIVQSLFTSYTSKKNLIKYYSHLVHVGQLELIQNFRARRILNIWEGIPIHNHQSVLDYGAGAGLFSRAILNKCPNSLVYAYDICPAIQEYLANTKKTLSPNLNERFTVLTSEPLFDFSLHQKFQMVICMDSLGEINSDDTSDLTEAISQKNFERVGELLEVHYGLTHKFQELSKLLSPDGYILFTEPFSDRDIFQYIQKAINDIGLVGTQFIGGPDLTLLKIARPH